MKAYKILTGYSNAADDNVFFVNADYYNTYEDELNFYRVGQFGETKVASFGRGQWVAVLEVKDNG